MDLLSINQLSLDIETEYNLHFSLQRNCIIYFILFFYFLELI